MRNVVFTIAMLFVMHTGVSYAELVKVVTLTNYEPFCFHQEGREGIHDEVPPGQESAFFAGMAWDILKESYHAMGYTIDLTVVSWKGAMSLIESGKADIIFPAVKTVGREEQYYFSHELSYPPNHFLIYTLRTNQIVWKGLASLNGKRVGIIRGFSYGKEWEEYIKAGAVHLSEYTDVRQGFLMLERGRLDAVVGYELSYDYLLKKWGWEQKYTRFPPFDESHSFLMGRKTPHVKQLLDVFDEGRRMIRESGMLEQILNKWNFGRVTDF